jgi:peptidoglycan/LPS O-acetylase OafA/YrhL
MLSSSVSPWREHPDFPLRAPQLLWLAFLIGALIGGRLGFAKSGVRRGWLTTVAVCEAALLFLAALASISFDSGSAKPSYSLYAVIVLMAVAMGLRNATVGNWPCLT